MSVAHSYVSLENIRVVLFLFFINALSAHVNAQQDNVKAKLVVHRLREHFIYTRLITALGKGESVVDFTRRLICIDVKTVVMATTEIVGF